MPEQAERFDWTDGVVAIIGREGRPAGAGFVVSAEGLIATCAHVLEQAGWPYQEWNSPVQVRFQATGRSAKAFVLEDCFRSQTDGDMAVMTLEAGLPEGVRALALDEATGAIGHKVQLWGYPGGGQKGLEVTGEVVALVRRDGGNLIEIGSSEVISGYSCGPVWDPLWGRVIGMILSTVEADAEGRLAYTTFAAPAEALVELCPDRLVLTPPVTLAAEATRHISGAVEELVDSYTERAFAGRDDSLHALDNWLEENVSGRMVVTALAGFGKTAMLANWMRGRQAHGDTVVAHFFSDRSDVLRPVTNAYANLLGQLFDYYGLYDEPLPDESARPDRLQALIDKHEPERDRRLIILLEALDEAEEPFQLALPTQLPDGVFLIVSARAGELDEDSDRPPYRPPYLESWADEAASLHLDRLPKVALAAWLAAVGDGALAEQSRYPDFVERLDERTDGYPLYLNYLLDELVEAKRAGQRLDAVLDQPPEGFSNYVRRQLDRLDESLDREEGFQVFLLLVVARYALLDTEMAALTELSFFGLASLPPGLIRWLNVDNTADGQRRYALAHVLLAQEFERALTDEAREMRDRLLDWCAAWPEVQSPYQMRHFAELLRRMERWEELEALAQNEEYERVQRRVFPLEPDLPLRTKRIADRDLDRLNDALDEQIPRRRSGANLLVATWNLKSFGGLTRKWLSGDDDAPKRDLGSLQAIAEILNRFDVAILQEVHGDLRALRELLRVMGRGWRFVMSDAHQGSAGNDERIAVIFDASRVQLFGLSGELKIPPDPTAQTDPRAPDRYLATAPYATSFRVGQHRITLLALYPLYGRKRGNIGENGRVIAGWLLEMAQTLEEEGGNLLLYGDFNVDRGGDEMYQAIISSGLAVPKALHDAPRTIFASQDSAQHKFYNQIGWLTRSGGRPILSLKYETGGFFDFVPYALASRELSKQALQWRISDHYPLWVEFSLG